MKLLRYALGFIAIIVGLGLIYAVTTLSLSIASISLLVIAVSFVGLGIALWFDPRMAAFLLAWWPLW